MPPGALTSAVSMRHGLIENRLCRVTGVSFTLRMYCMVQPVSSYGAGIGGGIILHAEVHVGERAVGLVGANDVIARGDVDGAGFERRVRAW